MIELQSFSIGTHSLVKKQLHNEQCLDSSLQYFDFFSSRTRHPHPCPPPSWGQPRWPQIILSIMISDAGPSPKTGGGVLSSNSGLRKIPGRFESEAGTIPTPTTPSTINHNDYAESAISVSSVSCGGHRAINCHGCADKAPSENSRYLWIKWNFSIKLWQSWMVWKDSQNCTPTIRK